MHVAWNDEGGIIEPRRQRFARRLGRVTTAPAVCLPGDQRALQQALRVEYHVVVAFADSAPEVAQLAPGSQTPEVLAPAPEGDRNDLGDGRVQTWNVGKRLLDAPIDLRARQAAAQVADHRQIVHYVTERRGLYQ